MPTLIQCPPIRVSTEKRARCFGTRYIKDLSHCLVCFTVRFFQVSSSPEKPKNLHVKLLAIDPTSFSHFPDYTVQVPPITLPPGSRTFMSACAGEAAY